MNNERRPSRDYLSKSTKSARTLVCGEGATCTRNVPGGAARLGCTGPSCRIDYSDTEEEVVTCSGAAVCDVEAGDGG